MTREERLLQLADEAKQGLTEDVSDLSDDAFIDRIFKPAPDVRQIIAMHLANLEAEVAKRLADRDAGGSE